MATALLTGTEMCNANLNFGCNKIKLLEANFCEDKKYISDVNFHLETLVLLHK